MVAYSFQERFAGPIQLGTKRQTIRADRKRHARPGEILQLYQGMRTKHCRKIIPDPRCVAVQPIRMVFSRHGLAELIELGGTFLHPGKNDAFAQADGFASAEDMAHFWWAEHKPDDVNTREIHFSGVLIQWEAQ